MKAIQTIELTDHEKTVVQEFLKLVYDISVIANKSMDNVFEYFYEEACIEDDNTYTIDTLHDITRI